MRKKTHEEFVKDFYSKHEPGEYLVLGEFTNSSTSILIRHNVCGKEYYAKPCNLYMGKGCRQCSNKRTHDEYVRLIQKIHGEEYQILGNYNGSKKKILVRHNKCGREYLVTADSLLRSRGCQKCAGLLRYTTEQVANEINLLTSGEYKLTSEYTANNKSIDVLHQQCGTVFETSYSLFVTFGSRCPLCNAGYRRDNDVFLKEILQLVGNEYTVLGQFNGTMQKVLMRHELCQHEYEVTPNKFFKGRRCPLCSSSKGETAIRNYLIKNSVKYKKEFKIKKCRDKQVLPFDFAIFDKDELLTLIEYQGEQHFRSLERFGWREKFRDRQRKDQIKRDFCHQNNIPLIEIPYTVKDIESYLDKQLQDLKL